MIDRSKLEEEIRGLDAHKRFDEALALCNKMINEYPPDDSCQGLYLAGDIEWRRGELGSARRYFGRLLARVRSGQCPWTYVGLEEELEETIENINEQEKGKRAELQAQQVEARQDRAIAPSKNRAPILFVLLGMGVLVTLVWGLSSRDTFSPQPAASEVSTSSIPPVTQLRDLDREYPREKRLFLDISQRGAWKGAWRLGRTVVATFNAPVDRAALAERVSSEWMSHRGHVDESDVRADDAIVVIGEATTADDVESAVTAVRARTRKRRDDVGAQRPVFHVILARADDPALQPRRWNPPPDAVQYSGPKPLIKLLSPSVSGRLSPDVVQKAMESNMHRIEQCYRSGLNRASRLAGTLQVRMSIGSDGIPSGSPGASTLADSGVIDCIVASLAELTFPSPPGGFAVAQIHIELRPGAK